MLKNKIIFLAIVGLIVVLTVVIIAVLPKTQPKTSDKTKDTSTGISVWIVDDDTAGFSDIITNFKKLHKKYQKSEITITSFASYEDYEKVLINVIADGKSPDIFIVRNNGGSALLQSKTMAIPDSIIRVDGFIKSFNKVFDELVTEEKGTDEKTGEPVVVQGIRGIPVGFETLALFYNYKLVKNVPSIWTDVDREIETNAKSQYSTVGAGMGGRYVVDAPDILALFLVQNGVDSFEKINDPTVGVSAIAGYQGYANDRKNFFGQFRDMMDSLYLTNIDLFVRGQVGMVIGYPSTLKRIDQAMKRSGSDQKLNDKLLRVAPIPQIAIRQDHMSNLVNYSYFALSKYATNPDMAADFLAYLATKDAQEKFITAFPYYLPALGELEAKMLNTSFKGYDRIKINAFLSDQIELKSFDKGLPKAFNDGVDQQLNKMTIPPKELAIKIRKYIDCEKAQYLNINAAALACDNN